MAEVTKSREISMFQSLMYSKGYLYEFFKDDVEQIISNINNDFPIDLNCSFKSAESVKEIEKDLKKKYRKDEDERVTSLCELLLIENEKQPNQALYQRVINEIGMMNLIKLKRKIGLPLVDSEIDYMIEKI